MSYKERLLHHRPDSHMRQVLPADAVFHHAGSSVGDEPPGAHRLQCGARHLQLDRGGYQLPGAATGRPEQSVRSPRLHSARLHRAVHGYDDSGGDSESSGLGPATELHFRVGHSSAALKQAHGEINFHGTDSVHVLRTQIHP